MDPHNGVLGAQIRAMGVCRPMVADSHHFEQQDSDPDPHQNDNSDPDPHQSKETETYQREKRDPEPGDADPQH